MAVGYMDGTIKIFNLDTCLCEVTFQGHKTSVTSMTYDSSGMKLASGSKVIYYSNCLTINIAVFLNNKNDQYTIIEKYWNMVHYSQMRVSEKCKSFKCPATCFNEKLILS